MQVVYFESIAFLVPGLCPGTPFMPGYTHFFSVRLRLSKIAAVVCGAWLYALTTAGAV